VPKQVKDKIEDALVQYHLDKKIVEKASASTNPRYFEESKKTWSIFIDKG
jgi:hypothetical protein